MRAHTPSPHDARRRPRALAGAARRPGGERTPGFTLKMDSARSSPSTTSTSTPTPRSSTSTATVDRLRHPQDEDLRRGRRRAATSSSRAPGSAARRPLHPRLRRRPASWSMMVDYNKIPHRFGNNGLILFAETSPGRWQIADTHPAVAAERRSSPAVRDRPDARSTTPILNRLITPYLERRQHDRPRPAARPHARRSSTSARWAAWPGSSSTPTRTGPATGRTARRSASATWSSSPSRSTTRPTTPRCRASWNGQERRPHLRLPLLDVQERRRHDDLRQPVPHHRLDRPVGLPGARAAPRSAARRPAQADLAPDNEAGTLFVERPAARRFVEHQRGAELQPDEAERRPAAVHAELGDPRHRLRRHATFAADDPANLPTAQADTPGRRPQLLRVGQRQASATPSRSASRSATTTTTTARRGSSSRATCAITASGRRSAASRCRTPTPSRTRRRSRLEHRRGEPARSRLQPPELGSRATARSRRATRTSSS